MNNPHKGSLVRLATKLAEGAMCEGSLLPGDRRRHTPYHLWSEHDKPGGRIKSLPPDDREAVKDLKEEHFNQRLFL